MTQRLSNRHILIVDDDEDILSSIDLAMRAEGATTSKAADGSAAVLAVQSSPPDAVVLDMMLPKASGFVVMEKIREQDRLPVVVMVTANLGKRHQQYAHDLGVHAYMNKPVSLQRLVETLVRLLEEREGGGKGKAGGSSGAGPAGADRPRAATGR
jgi:DNA-binding response OmpR family regulator